jgi:hypothetical protein
MTRTGLDARLGRLERSAVGGSVCARHDVALHIWTVEEDGTIKGEQVPEPRPCRACGRPAAELRIEIAIVPDRCREEMT